MGARGILAAAFGALLLSASGTWAQDGSSFVIGTYYQCDQSKEDRADELFKETVAPLLQKQIDAGHLVSYGWMSRGWAATGAVSST